MGDRDGVLLAPRALVLPQTLYDVVRFGLSLSDPTDPLDFH